ncbi:MAG: polyprenyl synthetase family protein [Pseudomonadota bacterium]
MSNPNPEAPLRASAPFEALLSQTAERVEAEFIGLLSNGPLATGHRAVPRVPERLQTAMRHAVLGGGKRFRPFLVEHTAALFDVPPSQSIITGIAVELIHCYSLAHDDLPAMDNDILRRGQPTVWKAFDDWTAILAGDALQALAFECLGAKTCHPDAEVRAALTVHLARASGGQGMVGGQVLDLAAERLTDQQVPTSLNAIRQLQSMKTGALIVFSCEAGALLGKAAGSPEHKALSTYGDRLGYAFQIADDLLDVEGDAELVGKAVAKDADAGKATLVSLMGVEAARAALQQTRDEAIQAVDIFGARADVLRQAADFVVKRRK